METIQGKTDKNEIIHVLSLETDFSVGDTVKGIINWPKRYNTMRLHSASHIMEYFLLDKAQMERTSSFVNENADVSRYRIPEEEQPVHDGWTVELENKVNEFIGREYDVLIEENAEGYRTWKCGPIYEGCGGTHVTNVREIGRVEISFTINGNNMVVETILKT